MIEAMLIDTCDIHTKGGALDGFNFQAKTLRKSDVPCLYTERREFTYENTEELQRLEITGTMFIGEKITELDFFLMNDGYFYEIETSGIIERRDSITGDVIFSETPVIRRLLSTYMPITTSVTPDVTAEEADVDM